MSYKKYNQYIKTESKFIEELPSDWSTKRLRYLAHIKLSGVDKKSIEGEEEIYLCNYNDVFKNDFINDDVDFMKATATEDEIEKFTLRKDDVIATKDSESPDEICIPAYVSNNFSNVICGYHLAQIRTFKEILIGRYLFRLAQSKSFNAQFIVRANGITRFGIGKLAFADAIVPIPSVDEQKQIAAFLDYKTNQIDNLIEKKEKLLKLLEEKRIALITNAVTKGIDPKVKMRPTGIDWLGEIPVHWDFKKIKFLSACNKNTLGEQTDPDYEILYVDISSVDYLQGIIEKNEMIFEKAPSRARRIVKSGDTIISTVRTYLKAIAYIDTDEENLIVSTGFAVFSPLDGIDDEYFSFYVQNQSFIDTIVAYSKGVNYPAIDSFDLKNLFITLPPLDEQRNIVNYIKKQVNELDSLSNKITTAITKLTEYRTSLITSAVTGKIDVRNWTPKEESKDDSLLEEVKDELK